jgi:hypothetical protein
MGQSRAKQVALIVFVVHPENIAKYVDAAQNLFGIEFDHMHGPTLGDASIDWDAFIDFDSGIEIVAPLGSASPGSANLTRFLQENGEGLHAIVFGVESLEGALANAAANGYQTGELITPRDVDARRRFLASYTKKIEDIQEARISPHFLGLEVIFGDIKYSVDQDASAG